MSELANSQGDSAQNEASNARGERPTEGKSRVQEFVNNGEEILQSLAKSVQSLQNDVRDLKRKNEEDEQRSKKRPKTDSTAQDTNSWVDLDSQAGASCIDAPCDNASSESENELEDLFPAEENNEESESQDVLEDLDQYFEPQTETGGKVSEKMATLANRALHETPNEEKMKKVMDKYKRPENITHLQIPKVDHSLWRVLAR